MTLDDRTMAALARLTDNEKECLRRRLLPQTAKEMALELGVSPHAIEKRLKMARTKLGLSSSLQAARLLVQSESQPLVPHAPDLAAGGAPPHALPVPGDRRRWPSGAIIAMTITIAAALAALLYGAPWQDTERRPGTPEEITTFLTRSFDSIDKDHSGFLEAAEAPQTRVRKNDGEAKTIDPKEAGRLFLNRHDTNGDGKVTRDEWIAFMRPDLEKNGIPVPRKRS